MNFRELCCEDVKLMSIRNFYYDDDDEPAGFISRY
jgi:hypothetical protein